MLFCAFLRNGYRLRGLLPVLLELSAATADAYRNFSAVLALVNWSGRCVAANGLQQSATTRPSAASCEFRPKHSANSIRFTTAIPYRLTGLSESAGLGIAVMLPRDRAKRQAQPGSKAEPYRWQRPVPVGGKYFIAIHLAKGYSPLALISFCDPKRNRRPRIPDSVAFFISKMAVWDARNPR